MSRWTRFRIALGIVREADPNAWQCFAGHWTNEHACPHHRMWVLRPPSGPLPPVSPLPPRPPVHVVVELSPAARASLDELG